MTNTGTWSRRCGIAALAVAGLVGSAAAVLAVAAPAVAAPNAIALRAADIDFTQTRAAGHNVITADGLHVYTDDATSQAKAAGYFPVGAALADVGEPTMSWTGIGDQPGPQPGLQLVVDFDRNGTADGILVGEPAAYGNDWWLANSAQQFVKDHAPSHTGGSGSDNHGTLDEWRQAFPHAIVQQGGWSLGSGVKGDGLISRIDIGETTYTFSTAPATTVTLHAGDLDFSDTRTAGHNRFLADGLRVYTDDSTSAAKAAGYFPVDIALARVGEPSLAWDGSDPAPGTQLVVDFDGDGTADGMLVGEPAVYGNDWWLSNSAQQFVKDLAPSHAGGSGSDNHGTLDQWRVVFPNARVLKAGYSLGSGVHGDGVISQIAVGTVGYRFANSSPEVAPVAPLSTKVGQPVSLNLSATDVDGDALTYATGPAPLHGKVSVTGNTVTYTPAHGFAGTDSFGYSVSDGISAPATGTVHVTVTSTPLSVPPTGPVKVAAGQSVNVTLAGTSPNGLPVTYAITVAPKHGHLAGTGRTRVYTPSVGYAGLDSFTYSVSDGAARPLSVTVQIVVTKAAVSLKVTRTPGRVTTRNHAGYTVRVSTTGQANGAEVRAYDGRTLIAGNVVRNGAASVKLPLLKRGLHHIKFVFAGSASTVTKSATVSLQVQAG